MQAAFGAATDAIFRDGNIAEDAIWRAGFRRRQHRSGHPIA
jgi:hypothetical protein